MFDFDLVNRIAVEKSKEILETRFDPEAYIVYVLSQTAVPGIMFQDYTGDAATDEKIETIVQEMLSMFGAYASLKSQGIDGSRELDRLLMYIKQLISELFANCGSAKEKVQVKGLISDLYNKFIKS